MISEYMTNEEFIGRFYFEIFAQLEAKIRSCLYDGQTHKKWIIHTKIVFKYLAHFEAKI